MADLLGAEPQYAIDARNRAGNPIDGGDILADIGAELTNQLTEAYTAIAHVICRNLRAKRKLSDTFAVDDLIVAAGNPEVYGDEIEDAAALAPLLATFLAENCNMQASPDGGSIKVSVRTSRPVAPPAPDPAHVAAFAALQALIRNGFVTDTNGATDLLVTLGLLPNTP